MAFVQKYYTADTHFGHQLMLSETACARPFADTKAMDEALIANWNAVVKPGDIVYHLGDFSFGLHDERMTLRVHATTRMATLAPALFATLSWMSSIMPLVTSAAG